MFKLKKKNLFKDLRINFKDISRRNFVDVDLSRNPILGLSIKSNPFLIHKKSYLRQTGGLVTGDYEERQYKLANINFSKGKHCDCCGDFIGYIPYKYESLCSKCKERMKLIDKKSKLISNSDEIKKAKLNKIWFIPQ